MKRCAPALLAAALLACGVGPSHLPDMALYADGLDTARSVAPQAGVSFDPNQSSDGRGSVRIEGDGGERVVELADVAIDAPKLPRFTYRGRLRCQGVSGRAYLELRVTVRDAGEHVARALQSQISGTSEWSTHETSYFLAEGQEVTRAKLNVVVEGTGTVWVDAITLRAGKD